MRSRRVILLAMAMYFFLAPEVALSLTPLASKHTVLQKLSITVPKNKPVFIPYASNSVKRWNGGLHVALSDQSEGPVDCPGSGVAIRVEDDAVVSGCQSMHSAAAASNDDLFPVVEQPHAAVSWDNWWQRIVRRLNTHEDSFGVHKISSMIWLLTSIGMLGTGISNGFSEIPDCLEIPTWLFLGSSVVQSITGIRMALKYRENDPAVQKGFINMSLALVNLAYTCVYFSPFATELSNEFWIGNGLFILTILPLVYLGTDEVLNLVDKMKHRRIRNKEPALVDFGMVGDLFSYGLAVFAGFIGATAGLLFAADPGHDRTWLLNAASNGVFGSPHYLAENYFSTILYNVGVGFGALAITMRDKKLISKSIEQTMVATFLIPGIYLNIHSLV